VVKDFWQRVLDLLCERVDAKTYESWIKPIAFGRLAGNDLFVEVPDPFFRDWLETHYAPTIREAAREITQKDISLFVAVKNQPTKKTDKTRSSPVPPPAFSASNISSRYTFDNFVVGSDNQFAHAASIAVSNSPALNYNPLFLFGGVGLGKTHLLHAIGHHSLKTGTCKRVLYLSSEQFTNELINSIRYERMSSFRERFRSLELLLLDDIQFIAGKERTQEEFFHTFNSLYESHHQIVLTSDTPPREMHFLEERLRSRFEWGLIADIQPPDLETKVAILRQKSLTYNTSIPNDVAFFLASNVESNIRELEGLLTRVVAFSSLNGCEITIGLAKDVLKNIIKTSEKDLSIETIQKVVSKRFDLKISDLKSKRRQRGFVLPRQISMYLARKLTKMSLPEIGAHFGGKDHSTVFHSIKKIEGLMDHDKKIKNDINNLLDKLRY
jgi:chromosomal replication initiator protein